MRGAEEWPAHGLGLRGRERALLGYLNDLSTLLTLFFFAYLKICLFFSHVVSTPYVLVLRTQGLCCLTDSCFLVLLLLLCLFFCLIRYKQAILLETAEPFQLIAQTFGL